MLEQVRLDELRLLTFRVPSSAIVTNWQPCLALRHPRAQARVAALVNPAAR